MRTNRWPLREIVARRYYRPKGFPKFTGGVELTLSCGHSEFRKRSRDPGRTARCWNCYLEGLDTVPEPISVGVDLSKQDDKGEGNVLSTTEA